MKPKTKKQIVWWTVYAAFIIILILTPSPWDLIVLIPTLWWAYRMDDVPTFGPVLQWTRPVEYPNECLWVAEPAPGVEYAVYDGNIEGQWKSFVSLGGGNPQLVGSSEPTTEALAKAACEKHWKSYPRK